MGRSRVRSGICLDRSKSVDFISILFSSLEVFETAFGMKAILTLGQAIFSLAQNTFTR